MQIILVFIMNTIVYGDAIKSVYLNQEFEYILYIHFVAKSSNVVAKI